MCQFLVLMESYCPAKNHEKNNEPIYEMDKWVDQWTERVDLLILYDFVLLLCKDPKSETCFFVIELEANPHYLTYLQKNLLTRVQGVSLPFTLISNFINIHTPY